MWFKLKSTLATSVTVSHCLTPRFSSFYRCYLVRRRVTMETRTVMQREMEEQSTQMSHSMQLSSQIKKKTFKSRCRPMLQSSIVDAVKNSLRYLLHLKITITLTKLLHQWLIEEVRPNSSMLTLASGNLSVYVFNNNRGTGQKWHLWYNSKVKPKCSFLHCRPKKNT